MTKEEQLHWQEEQKHQRILEQLDFSLINPERHGGPGGCSREIVDVREARLRLNELGVHSVEDLPDFRHLKTLGWCVRRQVEEILDETTLNEDLSRRVQKIGGWTSFCQLLDVWVRRV